MVRNAFGQHIPDILDCLAQLSNDEVPTPPKLANAMLDLLPAEVWTDPNLRWLDPGTKSGVFLREAASRLLVDLADWEPDFEKRRDHIFRRMLYGTSITEMTGQIARRSLYYSKDASSDHSVVRFADRGGNVPFVHTPHVLRNRRCAVCGAPEELERGENRENHAYSFIHGTYPTEDLKTMKFDVIVGNPPFQIGDGGGGGGASASPVYNLFVSQAISLRPRHVVMITPSRWFSGGKGLDEFRDAMLKDRHLAVLVDHPQLYDCFPGVKIRGGVSYFRWSKDHDGPCSITTKIGDETVGRAVERYLDEFDVLVRRNEAVEILHKITAFRVGGAREPSLMTNVSARKPFGLEAAHRGQDAPDGLSAPILLHGNQNRSWIDRSEVKANRAWIDQWKVLLVKAHGTSGRDDVTILGKPIVAGPGEACTETYLVVGRFGSREQAELLATYVRTRFVRFLVSLRKITQNITRDSYRFVPDVPLDRQWTDEALYARYGIEQAEVEFIESQVAEVASGMVTEQ